uniref:Uncharacterized protein n=1 Tax=Picea glauca TaxID=3330 RepID=A0A124GNI8_PICGL|nr:hypothetical protein ABT39_MTgene4304 [Picea glauca]QHR88430.1 hypothetical protein Q903MT_gene2443 [Picea sitchensis]
MRRLGDIARNPLLLEACIRTGSDYLILTLPLLPHTYHLTSVHPSYPHSLVTCFYIRILK